jgi:2-polyprenyl-3-methyl-5-hydroxy-6-metoxy-1,4-benzoquinol methylase
MQRRDPERVEPQAISELVPLTGKRVLDVGCGAGRLTTMAAESAASVDAFDPDAERVEQLDVARRRFDIALCGWSL